MQRRTLYFAPAAPMTKQQLDIAIVGAGIGGLTAALALTRAGFAVRVFEQAPVLAEVGAGLSLSPTAVHGLNALGLRETLETKAYKPEDQCVRHYQTAQPLVWINRGQALLEKYGERYYLIHRADLHDALAAQLRAAAPDAVQLNRKCVGVQQTGSRVQIRFDDGGVVESDVLIGADGSRSAVRQAVFGALEPQYTGYIAWRGLVPMEKVPKEVLDPPSGIFVGPGHLVNRYPVRNWQLLNFVAFAERRAWAEEGWSIRSSIDELLAEFAGWHPAVQQFMAQTPPQNLFKWGLFDREPLTTWHQGHIALLGDAAHPVLPFLGHGAVLAIEDGVVLARAFTAASSVADALARYERARMERAAFVVHESRKAGKQFHSADVDTYRQRTNNRAADEGLGLFSYNPVTQPV
jgi:salicylate hydroxylase